MIIQINTGAPRPTLLALLKLSLRGRPAPTQPTVLTKTPVDGYYYAVIEDIAAAGVFKAGLGQLNGVVFTEIDKIPGGKKLVKAKPTRTFFEELFLEITRPSGQPGGGRSSNPFRD